jgi:hypothetical protein
MEYTHVAGMILRYIEIAEETFKHERNKGREKKAFVMNFSKEIVTNLLQASPESKDIGWSTIEPVLSRFIDATVSLCNVFSSSGPEYEDFEWRKLVGTT